MATATENIQVAINSAKEAGAGGDAAFGWVSSIALALAAEIDVRAVAPVASTPVGSTTTAAAPAV